MNTQLKFMVVCLILVLCSMLFVHLKAIDREQVVIPEDMMKSECSTLELDELAILATINKFSRVSNYPCPVDFDQLLEETKRDLDHLENFIAAYSSNKNINTNKPKSARQSK